MEAVPRLTGSFRIPPAISYGIRNSWFSSSEVQSPYNLFKPQSNQSGILLSVFFHFTAHLSLSSSGPENSLQSTVESPDCSSNRLHYWWGKKRWMPTQQASHFWDERFRHPSSLYRKFKNYVQSTSYSLGLEFLNLRNVRHPALESWKIQKSKRADPQRYPISQKLLQRSSSVFQCALLATQGHHLMIISSLRAAASLRSQLLRASTVPDKDRKTNSKHRALYLALVWFS